MWSVLPNEIKNTERDGQYKKKVSEFLFKRNVIL